MLRRSVLLNLLGQFGISLIGFVPSIFVVRWLGPSGRGLYAVIGTASGIAFIVSSAGLPTAIWYFASKKKRVTGELLGNSLTYAAVLAAFFVPTAWIFRDQLGDALAHGHGGAAWVLAAVAIPISFLDLTTHNQVLGGLRFGYYNVLILLQKVSYFIGVVVLLRIMHLGVSGVFLATIAGSLLVIGGSLRVVLAEARPKFDRALLRQLLSYGARTQVGGIFYSLNSRLDVLILQFFRPLSAVGYYVVAQMLAELVMVIARAFQSSMLPLVTRSSDDLEHQTATGTTLLRHHGLLTVFAMVGNAAFSPLLILFAYGPAFHKALIPFFIILPGIWFLATGLVIATDLAARNRPGLSSTLSGMAVAITVVLDLALIPHFGVSGAAVASLSAYVTFGVISLFVAGRVAGIRVREFIPTRGDLALYFAAVRQLQARLSAPRITPTGESR